MANKTAKNLLGNRSEYSRYYGNFRGVDFSNDHTQIRDDRLAYLVNMYRDYQSGQGKALETVPGFRRRVKLPRGGEIYGIHHFKYNGAEKVVIHSGCELYLWHNYPNSIDVEEVLELTLGDGEDIGYGVKEYVLSLPDEVSHMVSLTKSSGEDVSANAVFDSAGHSLTVSLAAMSEGDRLLLTYKEGEWRAEDKLFSSMNERRSTSFIFNNRLYIIDGANYLCYDGERAYPVADSAYIPTTYINIIPAGENADGGEEYEQPNALQSKFAHTFCADGETVEFCMNEKGLDSIESVRVYGEELSRDEYVCDLDGGVVTLNTAPALPEDAGYPLKYAGVEIIASKLRGSGIRDSLTELSARDMIEGCTVAATFDDRVFLSGNPHFPNHVFFCGRNVTGYSDPSYFGILNFVTDGVGNVPVTGMIAVADTLMVLKGDTQQDGSVYFHSPSIGDNDITSRLYPSVRGLSGIGCLGACINFLDDPVFISRLGLEGVGQLSVRYERACEHRSSLVDAKLVNLPLERAFLEEWNGYLCVLVDGKVFLADSRQKFTHDSGVNQYEWYYLEGIGVYEGQYPEYKYAADFYEAYEDKTVRFCQNCLKGATACACPTDSGFINIPLVSAELIPDGIGGTEDLRGEVANVADGDGLPMCEIYDEMLTFTADGVTYNSPISYTVRTLYDERGSVSGYAAYLCEGRGNFTGGVFDPAVVMKNLDDNLFFGTRGGVVCSFNFDKRADDGAIATRYYDFDGRTIVCGCATKMDSCGIPHLNKNTVKKSTVIKTRAFAASAAKLKVRTNKKPYSQVARINSALFSFSDMDFSDFSFYLSDQTLFAVKEKEKKWVEKQYYLYSDEYRRPFALFYIAFRYYVTGRYKG